MSWPTVHNGIPRREGESGSLRVRLQVFFLTALLLAACFSTFLVTFYRARRINNSASKRRTIHQVALAAYVR